MKQLTGKATIKLVPSSATINVIKANVPKAIYSLGEGLNVAGSTPAVVTLCREAALEVSLLSSSRLWSSSRWMTETRGARAFPVASVASSSNFDSIADMGKR